MYHKKSILSLILFAVLMFALLPLWGAYLSNVPLTVSQPDGKELKIFVTGDEYYNWTHDKDGYTIKQNDKGWYVYMERQGNELAYTNLIVGSDRPTQRNLAPWTNIPTEEMGRIRTAKQSLSADTRNSRTSLTGTLNNIVVFVRFSDQSEYTQNLSTFSSIFNGTGNTMQAYFKEASYDALNIVSTFYPSTASTVVSYQDAHPRAYYCPYNASTNPIGYSSDTDMKSRQTALMTNAVMFVRSQIPLGLSIDNDNDGYVDNVCFIAQGDAEGWNSLLYPKKTLIDSGVTINGKVVKIVNFLIASPLLAEGTGQPSHEMFHSLGALDLYTYFNEYAYPVYKWDLMGYPTNPPQHMSAYMKYKYGHWISNIPTITTSGTYTLNPLVNSANNCYRINSPDSPNEYFIVEYRKKTGPFESSIFGSGLLVYRINENITTENINGPPYGAYVYRTDGTTTNEGWVAMANFSSDAGRTSINDTTNPSSFLSDGSPGGLSISNIGTCGATISFYVDVIKPSTITWTPSEINQTIIENQTGSENLVIGNSGDRTLNYNVTKQATQLTVLDETFATTSIPDGWSQSYISGTTPWVFATGGASNDNPSSAYDGTYNARFFYGGNGNNSTQLITPALNLSGASSATLTFWHTQAYNEGDFDFLSVFYRTSLTGSWTQLASYQVSIDPWTQETITLPNVTGTYYLAFQGNSNYGHGVCLDKIVVSMVNNASSSWLTINGGTEASGTIAGGAANNTITLGLNQNDMPIGDYTANIRVTSNSTTNNEVIIPVNLSVIAQPMITITAPTAGVSWQAGSVQTISWNYASTGPWVNLSYSTNGGTSWTVIGTGSVVTNSYQWTVPYVQSSNCKIKVTDTVYPFPEVISSVFTITKPNIIVDPDRYSYGDVGVNTTSGFTFTIANTGGTATLTGSIATPTGYIVSLQGSREFNEAGRKDNGAAKVTDRIDRHKSIQPDNRISSGQRNTLPYSVAAGATSTFLLNFTPTLVQSYTGFVTITDNAGDGSKTVFVTGQGGKSTIALSATTVTSGLMPGASGNKTLTIGNTGIVGLNYSLSISGTVPWLTINNGTSVTNNIAYGGASQTITFGFSSSTLTTGTYNATVNGTSNDPDSPTFTISVTLVVGEPITIIYPTTGTVWLGLTDVTCSWVYAGNSPTVNIYFSSDDGATWSLIGENVPAVNGINNKLVRALYVHSTNARLKIEETISPYCSVISNRFTNVCAMISVDPSTVIVPITNLTEFWQGQFYIINDGTGTLQGTIHVPTGYLTSWTGNPSQGWTTDLAFSTQPGQASCIGLKFSPTLAQSYNGFITITSNAANSPTLIPLTGTGGNPVLNTSATSLTANLIAGYTDYQTLTLTNTGNTDLHYDLEVFYNEATWLFINSTYQVSNTIAVGGAAQDVVISCNGDEIPQPGTYNAVIHGTSNDPNNPTFTISVTLNLAFPITILSPVGGENWIAGSTHTISWNYEGIGTVVYLDCSVDGGANWVQGSLPNTVLGVNSRNWTVPNATSNNCLIRIMEALEPNTFTISNAITIQQTIANLAQNPSPANSASSVVVSPLLNWDAPSSGAVTGYKVYLGTDNPPTNIVNGTIQSGTSYTLVSLAYNSTYFWKIVPYNRFGDTAGCPVWTFTTTGQMVIPLEPVLTDNGPLTTEVTIPGITGLADIDVTVAWAPIVPGFSGVGLQFIMSPTNFTLPGKTITITHNLGFTPIQIAYKVLPAATWSYLSHDSPNVTRWNSSLITFIVPSVKADGDLEVIFPSSVDETLAIELSSFTAIVTSNNTMVRLNWTTQSETNHLGYNVLRSETNQMNSCIQVNNVIISDGEQLGTVTNYTYNDSEIGTNSTYYYWLQSLDLSGSSTMFGPINVTTTEQPTPELPGISTMSNAYPNPFRMGTSTTIDVSVKEGESGTLKIYNVQGQVVQTYNVKQGLSKLTWNAKGCASGIYFQKLSTPSANSIKKMVIIN